MATLNRIGHHVASILDQQELLQHAVDAVRDDLGYLQAAVLLVDEEANELWVAAATDNFWEIISDGYRQPVGKGAIGIAAATEETVLVIDAPSDPRVYRVGKWLSSSSLSTPIRITGRVIGVLEVEADVPNAFDEGDVMVMATLADQVAVAIENARLYQATQQELADRKRAEEALRVQRDLAVALSATSDLTEALGRILEISFQVEGIDSGGVYLVDRLTGELDLVSHRGLPPQFVEHATHYAADSAQARLVMAGKPIYVLHSQVVPTVDEVRQREGLRGLAVIPVHYEGQVVAVLNLASHTHDEIPVIAVEIRPVAGLRTLARWSRCASPCSQSL